LRTQEREKRREERRNRRLDNDDILTDPYGIVDQLKRNEPTKDRQRIREKRRRSFQHVHINIPNCDNMDTVGNSALSSYSGNSLYNSARNRRRKV